MRIIVFLPAFIGHVKRTTYFVMLIKVTNLKNVTPKNGLDIRRNVAPAQPWLH